MPDTALVVETNNLQSAGSEEVTAGLVRLFAHLALEIAPVDEVVVTLFLSGTYMTIPKRMFNELIMQINPTITAIATILIGINTLAVYLLVLFMRRGGILGKRLT